MPRSATQAAVPGPWIERGACLDKPREWFFPGPSSNRIAALGKEVCAGCPVRDECLDYAMRTCQDHGTWGGMTARERRGKRRLYRLEMTTTEAP